MSAQRPMTYEELLERAKQLQQERDEAVEALREAKSCMDMLRGYIGDLDEDGDFDPEDLATPDIEEILSRYPEKS